MISKKVCRACWKKEYPGNNGWDDDAPPFYSWRCARNKFEAIEHKWNVEQLPSFCPYVLEHTVDIQNEENNEDM